MDSERLERLIGVSTDDLSGLDLTVLAARMISRECLVFTGIMLEMHCSPVAIRMMNAHRLQRQPRCYKHTARCEAVSR
jgi:hypothetical protein